MKRIPAFILSFVFTALVATHSSSHAAVDIFLKIDGIPGESLDSDHLDEIDVLSWSWQLSQSSNPANPIVRPMSVTKYTDLASVSLYTSLLTNTKAPNAVLTVRQVGGTNPLEYAVITMTDVTVSAVSNGASSADDRSTETISLNFSSACMEYTPQNPDGTPGLRY